jgi:hypothetical protein
MLQIFLTVLQLFAFFLNILRCDMNNDIWLEKLTIQKFYKVLQFWMENKWRTLNFKFSWNFNYDEQFIIIFSDIIYLCDLQCLCLD